MLDVDAAQDAAQEALISAYVNADQCSDPAHPEAWVWTIAYRQALRRRPRVLETLDSDEGVDCLLERELDRIDVRRGLATLAAGDREILGRFYFAAQRDHEIALDLDLPLGTVKIRLHRARRRLRAALNEGRSPGS